MFIIKKIGVLLSLLLMSLPLLSGCGKGEVTAKVYDEKLKEAEQMDYTQVVQELVAVANYKYTNVTDWTDEAATKFSKRITESDRESFLRDYNNFKEKMQTQKDSEKLDVTAHVMTAKEEYEKLVDFGQKHALLYTDNSKTNGTGVVYEIMPLSPGEGAMMWTVQSEQLTADAEAQALGEALPEIVVDREFLPTFELEDTLSYETPDTLRAAVDVSTDKDTLVGVFNDKFKTIYLTGDWGEYEPTEEEIRMSNLYSAGTGLDADGIIVGNINQEVWENYTLEEAREYVYNALNFHITQYNQSVTDEYNRFFTEEYQNEMRDIEKRQKEYIRRLEMEQRGELPEASEVKTPEEMYEFWRVSAKDDIEAIMESDMQNPEMSDIITKEGNNYYVEWVDLLKLVHETGSVEGTVFLKAYNMEFRIDTNEAPSGLLNTLLTNTKTNISDWAVAVTSAGVENFRVSLDFPDSTKAEVVFNLSNEDGLLRYDSSVGVILFN